MRYRFAYDRVYFILLLLLLFVANSYFSCICRRRLRLLRRRRLGFFPLLYKCYFLFLPPLRRFALLLYCFRFFVFGSHQFLLTGWKTRRAPAHANIHITHTHLTFFAQIRFQLPTLSFSALICVAQSLRLLSVFFSFSFDEAGSSGYFSNVPFRTS